MDRDRLYRPIEDLQRWCIRHWLPVLLFLGITALLVGRQATGWAWDFSVYSMNGQYLFHDGIYIEWYRAPMASVAMGLLSFVFGQHGAELAYTALVSTLFFAAAARFAEAYDLRLDLLYPLLVTPFASLHGLSEGTEMLALAFTLLFIADIRRPRSGIWMAGAFLTRYTSVVLVPLGLFGKDRRSLVTSYGLAALPVLAWFGFNWAATGHPLTSIGNSVGLNMVFRYFSEPVPWIGLLQYAAIPMAVAIYGLISRDRIQTSLGRLWQYVPVLLFGLLSSISYLRTPVKTVRYAYFLVFPLAVVGAALSPQRRRIAAVLAAISLVGTAGLFAVNPLPDESRYRPAHAVAGDCMAVSDAWPYTSYAGTQSIPAGNVTQVERSLRQGYQAIFTFDFPVEDLDVPNTTVHRRGTTTIVTTDDCLPERVVNTTYFERMGERLGFRPHRATPCGALFGVRCPWFGEPT